MMINNNYFYHVDYPIYIADTYGNLNLEMNYNEMHYADTDDQYGAIYYDNHEYGTLYWDAIGNYISTAASSQTSGIYVDCLPEHGTAYVNFDDNTFEQCKMAIWVKYVEYGFLYLNMTGILLILANMRLGYKMSHILM